MAEKRWYEIQQRPRGKASWRHCRYMRGRETAEAFAGRVLKKMGGDTRVCDAYLAEGKDIHVSPQKARLVVDLIRQRNAQKAIEVLRFTNKRISKQVAKILQSAIANAEQKSENIDVDKLFVCNAYVNEGLRVGRFRAASMGRAHPYQRRQSHIVIAVAERGS